MSTKMKLSDYAQYMCVCYRTAYRWAKQGKIKTERTPGGTFLVVLEDSDARTKGHDRTEV